MASTTSLERNTGSGPLRVVLIGDSTAFHGPDGRLRLDDPRLYQNVMVSEIRARLGREVSLSSYCRAGMTTREAWELISKDPAVQEFVLPSTDVVVFAAGSTDGLATALPTWLKDAIGHIPHTKLRRAVRRRYLENHRHFLRVLGGGFPTVPHSVTRDLWGRSIDALRWYSGGAHVVALTVQPSSGPHQGHIDPYSERVNAIVIEAATQKGVSYVDLHSICSGRFHKFNPDGIHWDYATHAEVGTQLASLVCEGMSTPKVATLDVPARAIRS